MNNFNKIYERIYNEANRDRLEKARKKHIRDIIIAITAALTLLFLMLFFQQVAFFVIMTLFAIGIILTVNSKGSNKKSSILKSPNDSYDILYKAQVISKLVRYADDSFEFEYYKGIPENEYRYGEFATGNIYSSEDYITGNLTDTIQFDMADTTVGNETTDSKGRTYTTYYFTGLLGRFIMENSINCTLKITMDKKEKKTLRKDPNYINIDSQEFEKIYNVHCTNKIMGMRVLTSDVMDNLLSIKKEYNIDFDFSIVGSVVFVRFHNHDLFEGPIRKQALDYEILLSYYKQIEAMLKVMNLLNSTIASKNL